MSSVFSSPIWEISNNWKCKTYLHTKMHRTEEIIGLNESSNTIWLYFKSLTVMTGYSDSVSELKKIKYIKRNYRSQHILEVKWKSSTRYLIIEKIMEFIIIHQLLVKVMKTKFFGQQTTNAHQYINGCSVARYEIKNSLLA